MSLSADNPIQKREDDSLGRAKGARSFAERVLSLDVTEGVVVGVLGPWGSGKTSYVNLARTELEKGAIAVLDFNPWMFSGAEQLIEAFFIELSSQLKLRPGLAEVGKDLEEYGEAFAGMGWLPIVGPWIERGRVAGNILGKLLQRKKEGINGRRTKVEDALGTLDKPLIVIVDDIDRLSTSEIRDIFKLVRLTGKFPNVVYIVVFDRVRVEQALGEQGIPGRDYLEKILQIGIDLPAVPANVLDRQICESIDSALETVGDIGPFDTNDWADVFVEIVRPLIRNMRDVRRYALAVQGTVRDLEGEVALVDVLALEAVRVFLPDVFRQVHGAVDVLTNTSSYSYSSREDEADLKKQVNGLIDKAGSHSEVVRSLIRRVFPGGERHLGGMHYGPDWNKDWLLNRRVAHEDILRLYLERVIGEKLQAFTQARQAWARITDRYAFDAFLRSLKPEMLRNVISSLEVYEGEFDHEHVFPGSVVLLNLMPELPEQSNRGMLDVGTRTLVERVVFRLIRSLKDPQTTEQIVRELLSNLTSLSSKSTLLNMVGHKEKEELKLISEAAARGLWKNWRDEIRAASKEALAKEPDLAWTFVVARRDAASDEPEIQIADSPGVTLALIRSARSYVRSQTMGNRAVQQSPRLAWDVLVELYGNEEILKTRLEKLKVAHIPDIGDLLELADRYATGWRPN